MKEPLPIPILPKILYQDDSVLVIMKPAGLLSIPDGYDPLIPHVRGVLFAQFGKLWIVHRLDRETSGVMLLAKSPAAHRDLSLQFEHRQVIKKYHTLVCAQPDWEEIQVDIPLLVSGDRKHRSLAALQNGKPALTIFLVLSRFTFGCLIEASPHSGYTHQIRAHLAAIGLPIMGDQVYFSIQPSEPYHKAATSNGFEWIQRVALHARSISFMLPGTGLPINLDAPYPDDFQAGLEKLK